MDNGTLAQWAGVIATSSAVAVALFKDEFQRWRRKPSLRVSIALAPPDCHKTFIPYEIQKIGLTFPQADCYYLRIRVKNVGKTRAEQVQVFGAKLSKRHADNIFKEVESFLPMNFRWTHGRHGTNEPEIFAEGISPKMGKHCDLGHIVDPKHREDFGHKLHNVKDDECLLALDLEVEPNTLSHLIPPGVYRLELRVAAANCQPVSHTFEINLTGKWSSDQAEMFSQGLGIKEIKKCIRQ